MKRVVVAVLLVSVVGCGGEDAIEPGPPLDIDSTTWFRAVEVELELNPLNGGSRKGVQILRPGPGDPPTGTEPEWDELFWPDGEMLPARRPPIYIQNFVSDGNGGWLADISATGGEPPRDPRSPDGWYHYRLVDRFSNIISNKAMVCVTRCP